MYGVLCARGESKYIRKFSCRSNKNCILPFTCQTGTDSRGVIKTGGLRTLMYFSSGDLCSYKGYLSRVRGALIISSQPSEVRI